MGWSFNRFFDWKRVLRLTTFGATVGGVGLCGTVLTTSAYASYAINRPRRRSYTDDFHLNPENFRMPYNKVEFATEDGVGLRGWWIPATLNGKDSTKILVLMHPYNNNKSNLLGVASGLWGMAGIPGLGSGGVLVVRQVQGFRLAGTA